MFTTLMILAALICGMFLASVASTITALRREGDEFRAIRDRSLAEAGMKTK